MSSRPEPRFVPPALYAILDVDAAHSRGVEPVQLATGWFDAGVTLLQIRAKTLPLGPFVELANAVMAVAGPRRATVIVNDRVDVAAIAGAHGVHIGQDDLPPTEVRRQLGDRVIVGLSTHISTQVEGALTEPIDYLAIGPVFPTGSKASEWQVVGLDGVRAAAALLGGRLPLVAIGGITLDRARDVLAAGASSVAVISDLLEGDPAERASRFVRELA